MERKIKRKRERERERKRNIGRIYKDICTWRFVFVFVFK